MVVPTACHKAWHWLGGAERKNEARWEYAELASSGRGATRRASPPRLGKATTLGPGSHRENCSANGCRSARSWQRAGTSTRTNSNSRSVLERTTGGHSQQ